VVLCLTIVWFFLSFLLSVVGLATVAWVQILKKDGQRARAAESYELAGDYHEMSGKGESSVRKCKEQRALILSEDEDQLELAAEIFQEVAEQCMGKNITKFHAKGWFQKCVLCHLAMGDAVGANEAAENAAMQDPRFPQGREGAFVLKIVDLCKERSDLAEFQKTLSNYNAITALDNWEADILIKIKRKYFPEGDAALADDLAGDVDDAGEGEEAGDDDLL
jgi:alpha-soluble NSF attachment protein